LIRTEAFFILSWQFELVTGGFSKKTAIFHNMLMKEMVNIPLQKINSWMQILKNDPANLFLKCF
jgi:hypothetical protein